MNNVVGDFNADGTPADPLGDGTLAKDMHARDADTIVGDNGDIIRIVGINGGQPAVPSSGADVAGCTTTAVNLDCTSQGVSLFNDYTRLRYITFNYDTYDGSVTTAYSPNGKLVVHGVTLLDYTPGGPDFQPDQFGLPTNGSCGPNTSPATGACSVPLPTCHGANFDASGGIYHDIGGADEVHAESGDDTVYTGCGNDVVFGDAQNDQITLGWGADWASGGTGQDGILGDDGRIFESRNESAGVSWNENYATGHGPWGGTGFTCTGDGGFDCLAEPLNGIQALLPTPDPYAKFSNGNVLNEYVYTPGEVQNATINVQDQLAMAFDITPFNLTPNALGSDQPLFDANNADDVIFGGWDNDFLHGGSGDDAISGAEARPTSYVQYFDPVTGNPTGLTLRRLEPPVEPGRHPPLRRGHEPVAFEPPQRQPAGRVPALRRVRPAARDRVQRRWHGLDGRHRRRASCTSWSTTHTDGRVTTRASPSTTRATARCTPRIPRAPSRSTATATTRSSAISATTGWSAGRARATRRRPAGIRRSRGTSAATRCGAAGATTCSTSTTTR